MRAVIRRASTVEIKIILFYTYVKVGRVGLGIGLGVRLLAFLMVTPWHKNSNR